MAGPLPPLTFYHTEGGLSSTFLLKKCYIFINNLLRNYYNLLQNYYETITELLQNYYEIITSYYENITSCYKAVTARSLVVNKFVTIN